MSYIAQAFIWLPIYVLLPHRKQLIELNHMPCIAHTTKSEPCLMARPSQMFYIFFMVFLHHRLRLMPRTQFRQRVSDRSVALAASYSSATLYHFFGLTY